MRSTLFIVSCIFVCVKQVTSWDPDAHSIVARIAANLLSRESTKNTIKQILVEGDKLNEGRTLESIMAHVSSFADYHSTIVDKSFKKYHFVDVPDRDCSGIDLSRDCGEGGCVVSAIPAFAMKVANTNLPMPERSLALKYLIHLVADVHQPMHIGFKGDYGGVGVSVHLPGHKRKHSLHQIWDSVIRTANGVSNRDSQTHAADLVKKIETSRRNPKRAIRRKAGSFVAQDGKSLTLSKLTNLALDMANETLRELTCKFAYSSGTDNNGNPIWITTRGYLDDEYFESRASLVDTQLIRAGVRLAYILEVIERQISFDSNKQLGISIDDAEVFDALESPQHVLRDFAAGRFYDEDNEKLKTPRNLHFAG